MAYHTALSIKEKRLVELLQWRLPCQEIPHNRESWRIYSPMAYSGISLHLPKLANSALHGNREADLARACAFGAPATTTRGQWDFKAPPEGRREGHLGYCFARIQTWKLNELHRATANCSLCAYIYIIYIYIYNISIYICLYLYIYIDVGVSWATG